MPVPVNEADKVLDHAVCKIMAAAFLKPQHGEIGIPIVDLVEAPTRDDVRPWQWEERGVRTERHAVGPAFEDLPQIVDVAAHVLARIAAIGAVLGRRHSEVSPNECREVEAWLAALLLIALHDSGRGTSFGSASTKVLPSGKTRCICTSTNN